MQFSQVARPKSGYMFYYHANYERVKGLNPKSRLGDIAKLCGAEWKALPIDDKKVFLELAVNDKKRYIEEQEAEAKLYGGKRLPHAVKVMGKIQGMSFYKSTKLSDFEKKDERGGDSSIPEADES